MNAASEIARPGRSPRHGPGPGFRALCLCCIAFPWLNPLAGGPSAVIQPWLMAASATLMLWILVEPQVSRQHLALATGFAIVLATLGAAAPAVLLAIGGLAVIALSAAIAAAPTSRRPMAGVIANAWLLAALASSVLALVQYFGLSPHLGGVVSPTEPGEAFANLRQRNQFATLSSIGLATLLWRVHQGARLSWVVPAVVLLAAANAASASRTGVLQIALLVTLSFWWLRPMGRGAATVCATAVLGYGLSAVLLPVALQDLSGVSAANAFARIASNDGCGSRAILWDNVLHLTAQKPWLGWGWGELDYAHFATLYPGARFCDILDNAHNLPLHLAVELGVPAAALACVGSGWWLWRQRPGREAEADATRQLAWSAIAVILLHSLLEYPLWYGPFQMAFGFSLGLLARERNVPDTRAVGRFGRAAVSGGLAVALLYAAWDYHRVSQLYTAPEQRSLLYRDLPLPNHGDSWLFRDQLAFAELSTTALTRENAASVHALAMELLHYSPEPRVIDAAVESAAWMGREDRALWLLVRKRAAFAQEPATAPGAAAAGGAEPQVRP